jgi:hypothetical protein
VSEKIGTLGMKGFAGSQILNSNTVKPVECLRYCLTLPVSVQITGIDNDAILDQALEVARTFKPYTSEELASLLERTRDAAMTGKFEFYKTTSAADGTARNPQYLG